jgi:glycosyltransferase involved in cell wall biosynthesis
MRCGVGDYTYRLCSELKKYNNIELSVITSEDPAVKTIPGARVLPLIKKWNFSNLGLLLKAIREIGPDLVHLQYPTQAYKNKIMINFFPWILRRSLGGTPLVVTIHDARTAHLLNKLRLIPFLFSAERIVLTVEEERDYLEKKASFVKPKSTVIPLGSNIEPMGLDESEKRNIRSKLGLAEGDILISHFGYILAKKKIETVIYAFKRIIDDGEKARLLFISSFDPEGDRYHARLKETVRQCGLEKFVIWTGYATGEDTSRYLSSSDVAIQVYADGVSFRRTSFITTLCHGLPIITTVLGHLPGGLRGDHDILAVAPGDVDGLVGAFKKLISSPGLRKELGGNAKSLSDRFSWGQIREKHLSLYKSVLGS